jgi:hypothetical protein
MGKKEEEGEECRGVCVWHFYLFNFQPRTAFNLLGGSGIEATGSDRLGLTTDVMTFRLSMIVRRPPTGTYRARLIFPRYRVRAMRALASNVQSRATCQRQKKFTG